MKTHLQMFLWGLMICLFVFAFEFARAPVAVAQDDDTAEEGDEPPAKANKAAKNEGGGAAAEPEQKNFLSWIIEVSGLIGLVLLVLSIYFVATAVRMFMEL